MGATADLARKQADLRVGRSYADHNGAEHETLGAPGKVSLVVGWKLCCQKQALARSPKPRYSPFDHTAHNQLWVFEAGLGRGRGSVGTSRKLLIGSHDFQANPERSFRHYRDPRKDYAQTLNLSQRKTD